MQKTDQAKRIGIAMPESYILFGISGSEGRSNAAFSRASSVIRDGSSIEWRMRRADPVRDVFETVRTNDQHAGW